MEKRIIIELSEQEVRAYKQRDGYKEFLLSHKLNFDDIFDQQDLERELDKLSEFIRKIKLQYCEYTIRAIARGLSEVLDVQRIDELKEGLLKYSNVKLHVVSKE